MKNWKFIKVGNSDKEFKSEQELRRWAIDHQYTYRPTHGGYYLLEDDSGKGREPLEAHVTAQVGNSETENRYTVPEASREYDKWKSEYEKTKSDEAKKNLEVIKEIIRKEFDMAYDRFQRLDEKKKNLQFNEGREGKISYYSEAQDEFKEWKRLKERVGNERYKGNQKYMNIPGYKQELERINRTYEKEFKQEKEEREKGYARARSEEQVNDYWDRQAKALDIYYSDKIKTGNKKYHIWTDNGTWDRIVDEEELERLKTTYKNFHVEEVKNESINKQTWSMFKGLSKDAEKEVGNTNWKQTGTNKWETELPNGAKIVVYYEKGVMADWNYQIDHKKSNTYIGSWARDKQEAMTESVERAKRLGNKKTGNQSTQDRFLDDINGIKSKYKQEGQELNLSKLMIELKKLGWAESDFTKLKWPANIGNAAVEADVVAREVVEGKEYIVEKTSLRNGQNVQFNLYYSMDGSGKRHAGVFKDKDSAVSAGKKIVGNETAEEKKFGKVMREFDRGELKSSSGETVTNPEQAKAIAYSESKEVNNLKRARNAMTKNAMGIADLEAQIKKNEEYIKSLQGKTVDSEGWSAKASIQEAQDEIDRMKSRIEELKKQGNKKG